MKKGSKHTKEAKEKVRLANMGRKNPGWKHGLTELQKKEKAAGRKKPRKCEICGAFNSGLNKGLCFDHNHKTGVFRGWICGRCNMVLGMVNDSTDLLNALIEYLKNE